MRSQVDKTTSWHKTNCQKHKLTKRQVDRKGKLTQRPLDRKTSWKNDQTVKRVTVKLSSWQNVAAPKMKKTWWETKTQFLQDLASKGSMVQLSIKIGILFHSYGWWNPRTRIAIVLALQYPRVRVTFI
jgi:hypothetical protein